MDKNTHNDSNMSLDSLEDNFKRATSIKDASEENVDTILVPFYEQDILIKVPKTQKMQFSDEKNKSTKNPNKSYLINKRTVQYPKKSYLQIFRKKNNPKEEQNNEEHEIRSLSPEYGDTERESICEDVTCPTEEFVNTESYNEIYYEKLMEKEYNQQLDNSFGDEVRFDKDFTTITEKDKPTSTSESSLPRRASHSPVKRPVIDIINNVKLGGLGPDMEKIKPRLERARSLQRYSEKVRMENRLKIYKKSIEMEKDNRQEKQLTPKNHIKKEITQTDCDSRQSYLLKRTTRDKSLQKLRKNYGLKSACTPKDKNQDKHMKSKDLISNDNVTQNKPVHKETKPRQMNMDQKDRAKNERSAGGRTRSASQNREGRPVDKVPPVKISFTVNFEGIRPSSALRRLEAKHKMYQEKVKKFTIQKENL